MNRRRLLWIPSLLVILGGLVGLDRSLERRREATRAQDSALRLLTGDREISPEQVAEVELGVSGTARRWSYRRDGAAWRVRQYRDAYAMGPNIDGLVQTLLLARGTLVGSLRQHGDHFGFLPDRRLVIGLYDASHRLLLETQVGHVVPGERGRESFVNVVGTDAILHMAANPWSYLTVSRDQRLPPLTDPRVIPGALGRGLPGEIGFAAPEGIEPASWVRREMRPEANEPFDPRQGPRFEWFARSQREEQPLLAEHALRYTALLANLTYLELIGTLPADDPRLSDPRFVVTLVYDDGARDVLTLLAPDQNRDYIHLSSTNQLFLIASSDAARLRPDADTP